MMTQMGDYLEARRKSLEEEFFLRENQRLLNKLRTEHVLEQSREALAEASKIEDATILDHLLGVGITAETVSALTMVPLVEVVWADGHMAEKEKAAILEAADRSGIRSGSVNYDLLQEWLSRRPDRHLRQAWRKYIQGLCEGLDSAQRETLKEDLLGRARKVAEVSGGILGLGSVSKAETEVLEDLENAFLSPE